MSQFITNYYDDVLEIVLILNKFFFKIRLLIKWLIDKLCISKYNNIFFHMIIN